MTPCMAPRPGRLPMSLTWPPDGVLLLVDGDVVAPFVGHPGGFHAGRPRTHHDDFFFLPYGGPGVLTGKGFEADLWILDTPQ